MTKPLFLASLLIITLSIACNQPTFTHTPLTDIEIIRDDFGVPHIYAPTDAGTAYGLAWAQCEDDFITMQEQMLAIKGLYGEVKGQDGAVADFGIKFMGLREIAEEQYETRLSDETRRLLEGYVNGANAYAKHHPDRLLHDEIFPITGIDLAVGTLLGLTNLTHGAHDLSGILGGAVVASLESDVPTGSNAIAVSKRLNPDGETLLAINSHQPMEGWYSWYGTSCKWRRPEHIRWNIRWRSDNLPWCKRTSRMGPYRQSSRHVRCISTGDASHRTTEV